MIRRLVGKTLLLCAVAWTPGPWDAMSGSGILRAQAPDSSVSAPDSAPARLGPPVRQIATASAVSSASFGSILGVRELPDGSVLVNDAVSRRLLLLDTMMVLQRVVLDSLSERENTYGTDDGVLIAHRGDTSLFVDQDAVAMLVLDESGEIVRVRAAPSVRRTNVFRGRRNVTPMTDARGRFVFQMSARPAPPSTPPPPGVPWIPDFPDSAFVVALDMDTRTLDTIGVVRTAAEQYNIRVRPGGGWSVSVDRNPLPAVDEWSVLSDGSIAFVRAIDYRVDYLNPDGTWTTSAKLPYHWRPISADEKQRIVDSVRAEQTFRAMTSFTTSVIRYVNTYNRNYPDNFSAPDGYVPPNGFLRSWRFPTGVTFPERYIYGCEPGEEPTILAAESADDDDVPARPMQMPNVAGPPPQGRPSCIPQPVPNLARIPNPPEMRDVNVVSPNALPDFFPPFDEGALRADMDGGLWIQTNQRPEDLGARANGGPIFDIISREGKLVDRIQVPRGYTIVGFGRDRVVFLASRDRPAGGQAGAVAAAAAAAGARAGAARGGVKLARVRLK